jgi:hypothetical protein
MATASNARTLPSGKPSAWSFFQSCEVVVGPVSIGVAFSMLVFMPEDSITGFGD